MTTFAENEAMKNAAASNYKKWPEPSFRTLGIQPGPVSHLATVDGPEYWVCGALTYDRTAKEIGSYAMRDASDLERKYITGLKANLRSRYNAHATMDDVLQELDWQEVDGREGMYVVAVARLCQFGPPDPDMTSPAGALELDEDNDPTPHMRVMLEDRDALPAGAVQDTEFRMDRVWSPDHGVQLQVHVQSHAADGPGHSVEVLRSFQQWLGLELDRLAQDHPEQAGYWSGE